MAGINKQAKNRVKCSREIVCHTRNRASGRSAITGTGRANPNDVSLPACVCAPYIHLDCQLGFEKRYQRWPKYESVCS